MRGLGDFHTFSCPFCFQSSYSVKLVLTFKRGVLGLLLLVLGTSQMLIQFCMWEKIDVMQLLNRLLKIMKSLLVPKISCDLCLLFV